MFKRIKAWFARRKKRTGEIQDFAPTKPFCKIGYNRTGKPIREGALVTGEVTECGAFEISPLTAPLLRYDAGFFSSLVTRLKPSKPFSLDYVGVAVEDIPKEEYGCIQIAGFTPVDTESDAVAMEANRSE